MTKRTQNIIYACGSVLLCAVLVVLWIGSQQQSSAALCQGINVVVVDSANQNFVTADEVRRELGRLPLIARRTPVKMMNTDSLERELRVIDKIETVHVTRLTDGTIRIVVEPMRPVARIFDRDRSYYINKDGKRIEAVARYHVDVPIIQGSFPETDTAMNPVHYLPLLETVSASKRWSNLVTMVKVDNPDNIFLIPPVKGLVFNIGNRENVEEKLKRLERMIDEVIPRYGWEKYDTVSVKWRGQIVAHRRHAMQRDTTAVEEEISENDDLETMSVGTGVAAGQALPGKKANSEKPVPGAKNKNNNNE